MTTPHDNTTPVGPPPRIVIDHRYRPRLCAASDCSLPPHVRWRVLRGGMLFGQYRRTGDALDLCDSHEREAADVCDAEWDDDPVLPMQRGSQSDGVRSVTVSEGGNA
ncbi:hypothetical protein [Micromonospora sp. NPDC050695]|uniref:hypothetical protein n=1 Tax=Micromonospora sp. NPDC050695 TaxID=3154938 RepID=UPI00340AB240